jgi:hypothetical protein
MVFSFAVDHGRSMVSNIQTVGLVCASSNSPNVSINELAVIMVAMVRAGA